METVLAAPECGEARLIPVCGGTSLCLADGRLFLAAEPPADAVWDWRAEPSFRWGAWRLERSFEHRADASGVECACFDAALLPPILTVGAPRPGERMLPFGRKTAENLHKLRIDRGVGAYPPPPVLRTDSGEVIWACLVRRSAAAPVGEPTREAVCFRCFRDGE